MPLYRLPSQFLLAAAVQAPLFSFSYLYDVTTTGQLGLALMALALPIQLFGYTMGKAYFGEISSIGKLNPDKIMLLSKKIVYKLLILGVWPTVALLVFGEYIFLHLFGDTWRQAGKFSSLLAIYLLFQFISAPLGSLLTVFEKQFLFFRINLFRIFIVGLVFVLAGIFELTPESTILFYSIAMSIHYIQSMYITFKVIK